jgi:hypothetical protein
MRHHHTGIKLGVIDKSPAVNPDFHALYRLLEGHDRKCISVALFKIAEAQFIRFACDTDLNVVTRVVANVASKVITDFIQNLTQFVCHWSNPFPVVQSVRHRSTAGRKMLNPKKWDVISDYAAYPGCHF